ncbi:MAG: general secretion pathway protein GspB, partial [Steroidobacteraceae bacterium]
LPRSAAGTAAAALANGSPGAGAATPADSAAAAENPADLTPAVAAPQSAVPQGTSTQQGTSVQDSGGSVVRESNSGLPTYQELASQPGSQLPQLELDLHVYSPQPDQRFVFLNMTKLREGDSLPQGVRVDTITPSGVILSYRGKRFVLQR